MLLYHKCLKYIIRLNIQRALYKIPVTYLNKVFLKKKSKSQVVDKVTTTLLCSVKTYTSSLSRLVVMNVFKFEFNFIVVRVTLYEEKWFWEKRFNFLVIKVLLHPTLSIKIKNALKYTLRQHRENYRTIVTGSNTIL